MSELSSHLHKIEAAMGRLDVLREEACLARANDHARAGRYSRAADELRATRFNQSDLEIAALLLLSKISAQQSQFETARQHLLRVLELDPGHPEAAVGIAALSGMTSTPALLYLTDKLFKLALIVLAGGVIVAVIGGKLRIDHEAALIPMSNQLSQVRSRMIETSAQVSEIDSRLTELSRESETKLEALHAFFRDRSDEVGATLSTSLSEVNASVVEARAENNQAITNLSTDQARRFGDLRAAAALELESINVSLGLLHVDLKKLKRNLERPDLERLRRRVESMSRTLTVAVNILNQSSDEETVVADDSLSDPQRYELLQWLLEHQSVDIDLLRTELDSALGPYD